MIPVVLGNVASIGEAAGCVSPLLGEGILSAMETAEWLAYSIEHGTYPQSYLAKVEEMQESYSKSWKTWNLMNKHPHLGWVLSFVYGMKSSKFRSKPSVTKRAIASIIWNWLNSLI